MDGWTYLHKYLRMIFKSIAHHLSGGREPWLAGHRRLFGGQVDLLVVVVICLVMVGICGVTFAARWLAIGICWVAVGICWVPIGRPL